MKETKIRIILVVALVLLILAVIYNLNYTNTKYNQITDFESCVNAGNPVMESYPRQCRDNDITFVEDISNDLNPLAISNYFYDQLYKKGVENLGAMPIEGFNPELYKIAFPGLIDSDFDQTYAISGKWIIENNILKFIRDNDGLVTSADGTLTKIGINTLLDNISNRLSISKDSKENIDLIINKIINQ